MQFDTMLTVDEYARLPREPGHRLELSRGLLVRRTHPSPLHAHVASRIYDALSAYAADNGGRVAFHAHFLLQDEPPTVRGPDIAFMTNGRGLDDTAEAVLRTPPDLAIEIGSQSPDGARAELLEKVFEYLDAGTRMVWIVQLLARSIVVHQREAEPRVYQAGHIIRGGSVLPGFQQPVSSFFA